MNWNAVTKPLLKAMGVFARELLKELTEPEPQPESAVAVRSRRNRNRPESRRQPEGRAATKR